MEARRGPRTSKAGAAPALSWKCLRHGKLAAMGRILTLLVIAALVYLVFRGFFRSQVRERESPRHATSAQGEDMIACARCGVNLPRSDAREEAGRWVCQGNPHC